MKEDENHDSARHGSVARGFNGQNLASVESSMDLILTNKWQLLKTESLVTCVSLNDVKEFKRCEINHFKRHFFNI